jgi:hypothetical protein
MLYTHLGRIVAALALLFGILWLSVGAWMLYVAQSVEPLDAQLQMANVFDRTIYPGIQTVLIAIALGVLTEISRSVQSHGPSPSRT